MEKIKAENRVFLFDNIKFFLISTVVVGHIIDFATAESDVYKSIFLFIYSFHMPLFIFLSGLFNKNRDTKKKVISFIFLGFAFDISYISVDVKKSYIVPIISSVRYPFELLPI